MESFLAIISCIGVGLTLSVLKLRPRFNLPSWPSLHDCMDTQLERENTFSEEDGGLKKICLIPAKKNNETVQDLVCCNDKISTTMDDGAINISADTGSVQLEESNECISLLDDATIAFHKVSKRQNLEELESTAAALNSDSSGKRSISSRPLCRQRRVLFVIAHPDDECMFFGPAILHFTQKEKALVFLICLTNGSYNSPVIGKQRQIELWESCQVLGIPAGHITLYRCRHFPDHPSKSWPIVNAANIINKHLHSLQCDMVVTFDGGGVSGHINHRSLYACLCYLTEEKLLPHGCHPYTLDSVNLLRKYSSVLDMPYSQLFSDTMVTVDTSQYCTIRTAMRCHASQYVWFRRLYMIFSRYVVINTLTPLPTPDTSASAW